MFKIPKVFLSLDRGRAGSQGILRGIAKYARLHGPWQFYSRPPFYRDNGKTAKTFNLPDAQIDGVIAYIIDKKNVQELISRKISSIVIPIREIVPGICNIMDNWKATGTIAAEYFLKKGFRRFAYCGLSNVIWAEQRGRYFASRIKQAGFDVQFYKYPESVIPAWEKELPYMKKWIKSLPKPIALFAWNDERGENVIEACMLANIKVPQDIAVLGVDNDDLICDVCDVPLSSVVMDFEKTGYKAAQMLDVMMKKHLVMDGKIEIEPITIVTRKSTDVFAINDENIEKAIRFIQQHSDKNIKVDDIADAILISKRTLQRKFARFIDHSLHDEIRNHRIERVCRMLENTNLTVSQIAYSLNFSEVSDLNRSFKKNKGLTPLDYRMKYSKIKYND